MRKSFDELTIADDFMFCTVMQDAKLCKKLLELVLEKYIGTINDITYQKTIAESYNGKSIRLDVVAGDNKGRLYDVEMQVTNERNLAKRLRYYQAALDISYLNKGADYNELPESYIVFFCTFDYLKKELPVYTFKTTCIEDNKILLKDGITKVIANSQAASKEQKKELQDFLYFMNGNLGNTEFVKEIENKIESLKENEKLREEYMLLSPLEMDARREGRQEGIQQGVQKGRQEGIYLHKIETAKKMKKAKLPIQTIAQFSGLSIKEIEDLF